MRKVLGFIIYFTCILSSHSAKDSKPLLALDLGPWKTGTSALRAHLQRDKEALERQGVLYPEQVHTWEGMNKIPMRNGIAMDAYPSDYFKRIAQAAKKRKCHTVIFINENFFCGMGGGDTNKQLNLDQRIEDVKKAFAMMAPHFNLSVTIRTRELYGWLSSIYWQNRKCGLWFSSLEELVDSEDPYTFRMEWPTVLTKGPFAPSLQVCNFEEWKKKGMYLAFLEAHGLQKYNQHLNLDPMTDNVRPTLSITNIFERMRLAQHHVGTITRGAFYLKLIAAGKKGAPFYHYDQRVAEKIYAKFSPLLTAFNKLLAEKLPTTPQQPEGYVEEWDKEKIDRQDEKVLAKFKPKLGTFPKPEDAR